MKLIKARQIGLLVRILGLSDAKTLMPRNHSRREKRRARAKVAANLGKLANSESIERSNVIVQFHETDSRPRDSLVLATGGTIARELNGVMVGDGIMVADESLSGASVLIGDSTR